MTGSVDPVRPFERRQTRRRAEDLSRPAGADGGTNLPAVIEPAHAEDLADPPPAEGYSTFAAQMYGQTGQKRGLRGGQPVIDQARAAYLETEYSGPDDRRPPKGLLKKTEI
ncbi:MAG TPA: hypothetical protein PLO65_10365 [Caulobacter sp.]|nr:hypothetical protein [Caulobacter sp.]